jgi:hypothetical protein
MKTIRAEMLATSDFAAVKFTKPVVPDGPVTLKLTMPAVELNAKSVTVEFDTMLSGCPRTER